MKHTTAEILIVGAGPVGLALALALHHGGRSVRLIDARAAGAGEHDARVLALSHGSRQTLERFGAWPESGWTPIEHIHVSQRGAFGRTTLAAQEYGIPALGYVMPAAVLYRALMAQAERAGIAIDHDTRVDTLDAGENGIAAQLNGRQIEARLAACCEGGIGASAAAVRSRDYGQHALIARAAIARPHGHTAYERFTPEGPLALLPHGADYSVVWTATPERAAQLLALAETEFRDALQTAFGQRVRFTGISERASFPLGLKVRRHPIGQRTVWLGNAAQTLHPVAGQGFNLALRDVWELAELLTAPETSDPGGGALLARYAHKRLLDRAGTIGFTDGLVRLFSNADPVLQHLRGAGLFALDMLPPLRHFLAKRMLFGARAWP
ncbi:MAG: FAD-dependent monooxygenase [Betaproteobacteria bacterium]|nr:FAD-dependent monooxygenase [Betaproteobacteria bacterium]